MEEEHGAGRPEAKDALFLPGGPRSRLRRQGKLSPESLLSSETPCASGRQTERIVPPPTTRQAGACCSSRLLDLVARVVPHTLGRLVVEVVDVAVFRHLFLQRGTGRPPARQAAWTGSNGLLSTAGKATRRRPCLPMRR